MSLKQWADYLETCRRKRNIAEYDRAGVVTEQDASELNQSKKHWDTVLRMPRACLVEVHAGSYNNFFQMPRACLVEFHAGSYKRSLHFSRCHELVSWRLTLRATVAANVNLHETSSWHLKSNAGAL
jgi:hypothetical protein